MAIFEGSFWSTKVHLELSLSRLHNTTKEKQEQVSRQVILNVPSEIDKECENIIVIIRRCNLRDVPILFLGRYLSEEHRIFLQEFARLNVTDKAYGLAEIHHKR